MHDLKGIGDNYMGIDLGWRDQTVLAAYSVEDARVTAYSRTIKGTRFGLSGSAGPVFP